MVLRIEINPVAVIGQSAGVGIPIVGWRLGRTSSIGLEDDAIGLSKELVATR